MEEGWFVGRQWPFMIIKRKSDGKLLNVSDKKVRVYESMYTVPMNDEYDPTVFPNDADESCESYRVLLAGTFMYYATLVR